VAASFPLLERITIYSAWKYLRTTLLHLFPNFVGTMEKISDLMRTAGFGTTQMGTGPDANYGLAQCYGDLNLLDCVLCYAEGRGRFTGCFPYNSGRPQDKTICGNTTRKDTNFQESAKELCWMQRGGGSKINKGVIIAIVVSSVAFAVIGAIIGLTIRKNTILQRKRRGSSDIVKMSRTLNDSSLNFKFSTLQKATGNFDDANKLGQGGFGIVYKAWKHFQRGTADEIFDPNLMLQNYSNSSYIKNDILRVLHVGLLCAQEVPSLRPFMSTVLKMLSKRDEQLPVPTNPPFIDERTMELNDISEDSSQPFNNSFSPSVASMSHSAFYPR
ncbi:hypothetical protein IFM89_030882, partial [Coptis chinensis]